jgi:hypothetical protein
MAQVPPEVHRLEMAYTNGQMMPMLVTLNAAGRDTPPELRAGNLVNMLRDLPKYLRGTPFMVIGGVTDIANRNHDVRVLFFDGPALADYSHLRFAFAPPGSPRDSDKPTWQDPNYGTVLSIEEAQQKLFVPVDIVDALIADGSMPVKWGVRVELVGGTVRVREFEPGGVAEKSELRPGDVLIEANGKPVDSIVSFVEARVDASRTRTLALKVLRGAKKLTFTLRE